MAELGKAYVQIVPSARGIEGSISKVLRGEAVAAGKSSGESISASLVSTIKKAVAAAGIGTVISKAMSEGAALQQSIGGIQTLFNGTKNGFEDYSNQMIEYANQAYETAGLSANKYMEQVTSFSASLLQSLGGDTKKAGDAANQAVIDMADNANKMGTSMEAIQNAYQGFSKQNYTMLDNLKLGYGGTKTEMERLLSDAEALTGVKYDINNLSDVYSAIHVIQDELGITNTTSEEAAKTFTGSMAAMKASLSNLLGAMTTDGNVADEVKALFDTMKIFVKNNAIPMLKTFAKSIPNIFKTAAPLIGDAVTGMIEQFAGSFMNAAPGLLTAAKEPIDAFLNGITERLPDLLDKGVEIVKNIADGIWTNLPAIITAAGDILNSFVEFVAQNLPLIMSKGAELISYLAEGLLSNMPAILDAIRNVMIQLATTIIQHLPEFLSAGGRLLLSLAEGILTMIAVVIAAGVAVIQGVLTAILNFVGDMLSAGKELIQNVADGIIQLKNTAVSSARNVAQAALDKIKGFASDMFNAGKEWIQKVIDGIAQMVSNLTTKMSNVASDALNSFTADWSSLGSNIISGIVSGIGDGGSIFSSLRGIASNALQAAKDALHIGSPSKLFRDEVGKWIPEGIAEGIASVDTPTVEIEKTVNGMVSATSAQLSKAKLGAPQVAPSPAAAGEWTINVYAAPGMDENMLADKVARRINQQIRTKGAVYA